MLIDGITTTATSKVQVASTPSAASDVVTKAFLENTSAVLDGSGKVPASKLPQLVITDTFVVSSQAAMLATGAEQGDIAIRIDQSKTYILAGSDATVLANWTELVAGSGGVTSVNGLTGAVTLDVYTKTQVDSLIAQDPYWAQTAALCHFEDATVLSGVGTASFSQASGSAGGFSSVDPKFGTYCFDTSNAVGIMSIPGVSAISGDFTLEFFIASSNMSGAYVYAPNGTNTLIIGSGEIWVGGVQTQSGSWFTMNGSMNHVAIVRQSGSMKLFVNGSQVGGQSGIATTLNLSTLYFGGAANNLSTYRSNCKIDEFRLSLFARSFSSFTVPTSQYPGMGSSSVSITGDATGSGSSSIALTLANSGVTAGTYGSSSLVPVVTVDAKGRVTGVTTQSISAPAPTTTASITTWTGTPYDLAFSIFGKPSTAEVVFRFVASRAFTIPANFAGAIAKAQTAATNSAAFEIKKNGASLGYINFGAGGTSGSFASNPATSFASGDVLSITVLTLDSTLADIDFTIPATLN